MWYDWEYVQAAMEDWHYAVIDAAGEVVAQTVVRQGRLAMLAHYAERFAQ